MIRVYNAISCEVSSREIHTHLIFCLWIEVHEIQLKSCFFIIISIVV